MLARHVKDALARIDADVAFDLTARIESVGDCARQHRIAPGSEKSRRRTQ